MHTLKVCRPRAELRTYVRTFVQRYISPASAPVLEPTTAQLEQILAFDFGTPVEIFHPDGRIETVPASSAAGAQTRFACQMHLRGGAESFGIFFQPTGFVHLFGVPTCELTNRLGDASAILGTVARELWNQLGESSSFEDRVSIAERFLMRHASRAKTLGQVVAAADYLFREHGAVNVTNLANQGFTGVRQFERQFRQEIGASPKMFARVARFQAALDAKVAAPKRTWLDIAHSFGYYDQMHMIHDFEQLGRDSPTRLVTKLGDSRPPALVSLETESAVSSLLIGTTQTV